MSQAGYSGTQVTIVDNTSRYDTLRLASMVAQPGVRSMQTAAIRYPYWENVALAWEDVLIPLAVLSLVLRFGPFLFMLYLLLWYATHRSWTLGDGVKYIRDRIYDLQSERIYGRPAKASLSNAEDVPGHGEEALTDTGADGHMAEGLPEDGSADACTEEGPLAAGAGEYTEEGPPEDGSVDTFIEEGPPEDGSADERTDEGLPGI